MEIISISCFSVALPCGEGYLAEICALLGQLSLSLLATLSCEFIFAIGWMDDALSLLEACFLLYGGICLVNQGFILLMLQLGKDFMFTALFSWL